MSIKITLFLAHNKEPYQAEVIFQKRVRVFYRGLETLLKHEAQVFEMASQSAPYCKQKRTRESKNHISMRFFALFCLISAQFVMTMSVFFTTEACLFQVATFCIQWHPARFKTWTG